MKDKVVVVTGGFGTLGRVLGEQARLAGARVVLIDLAAQAPTDAGGDIVCMPGRDLQMPDLASGALEEVCARFGRVDALANVAGGFRWETVGSRETATWDLLYGMNLRTALNMSRAAIVQMTRQRAGAIVNVGAYAALKASAGMGAYAASKSAVHRLTEALAEEGKAVGIRVNAVLPSILDTPTNRANMPHADVSAWVTPSALAQVMLFLMSANCVTGTLLPVTGGV